MQKGKFIVLEGIDGSGKSTIVKKLTEKISEKAGRCHSTFEPTDSPIGSLIRNILNKRIISDDKTIGALFLADRLDHIQNPVNGMLSYIDKGVHVISDRYYFSSYAYHAPMLDMDWIVQANSVCAELLRPDIIFYIDISVEEGLKRMQKSRSFLDLFETREKMETVHGNYQKALEKYGQNENIIIINGEQEPGKVFDEVWNHVVKILD